jgi:hypothetical protein
LLWSDVSDALFDALILFLVPHVPTLPSLGGCVRWSWRDTFVEKSLAALISTVNAGLLVDGG